jgi:hypothetical protein
MGEVSGVFLKARPSAFARPAALRKKGQLSPPRVQGGMTGKLTAAYFM